MNDVVVISPDDSFFWCSIDVVSPFLNGSDNCKEFLLRGIVSFFH